MVVRAKHSERKKGRQGKSYLTSLRRLEFQLFLTGAPAAAGDSRRDARSCHPTRLEKISAATIYSPVVPAFSDTKRIVRRC